MARTPDGEVARLVWLQVRLTERERELLAKGAAAAIGRPSVSAYVRQVMLERAKRDIAKAQSAA